MVSLWGNMTGAEIVGAAQQIGVNWREYEDRERKIKREDAADKRLANQEKRAQEAHDYSMESKQHATKIQDVSGLLAQADAAKKEGNIAEFDRLTLEAYSLIDDGVHVMDAQDTGNISPEDKARITATNPEMKGVLDKEVVGKVYDDRTDRVDFIGTSRDELFNRALAWTNPQNYFKQRAERQAQIDKYNSDAQPVLYVKDDNTYGAYSTQFVPDGEGGFVKERIEIDPEQLGPSFLSEGKALIKAKQRENERYGLDTAQARATLDKTKAEINKIKGAISKPKRMKSAEWNTIRDELANSIGITNLELMSADEVNRFNRLKGHAENLYSRGVDFGRIGALALLAEQQMSAQTPPPEEGDDQGEPTPEPVPEPTPKKETPKKEKIRAGLKSKPVSEWNVSADGMAVVNGKRVKLNEDEFNKWIEWREKEDKKEGKLGLGAAIRRAYDALPKEGRLPADFARR